MLEEPPKLKFVEYKPAVYDCAGENMYIGKLGDSHSDILREQKGEINPFELCISGAILILNNVPDIAIFIVDVPSLPKEVLSKLQENYLVMNDSYYWLSLDKNGIINIESKLSIKSRLS